MRWKYYIPSVWEPGERQTWEDIWLLPDDQNYVGESLWITIDSLPSAREFVFEEGKPPPSIEPGGFEIAGVDMIVGVNDFSREELLQWAEVWLTESGFRDPQLVEATFEEFKNTNDEARALTEALEKTRGEG